MLPLQSSVSELPKFWAATFCPNPDFLSYERGNSQNSLLWFRVDVDLTKNFFLRKSAIFHSIKLPFDAEVAEKFLNGIY